MWAVLWAAPLAMPVPGNSDDVPQLPLPPSNVRAWRLPGLPSKSRIIRVLECEYAHLETLNDGVRSVAPGQNHTSAASRMPHLQSCVAEELSRWYHAVPATSLMPDADSMWFSYTDIISEPGIDRGGQPPEAFPTERVMGLILSNDVSVDSAYSHDSWSTQPDPRYPRCNASNYHGTAHYARVRYQEMTQRCNILKEMADLKRQNKKPSKLKQYYIWKRAFLSHWVRESGHTCRHDTIAEAEADQRALLKVLVDKGLEGCEAGPLYNQLQIRYSVRMIEGLFYTPALRAEALMTRDAIESIHRAFGMSKNLKMVEAVRTPDYMDAPLLGRSTQKIEDPPDSEDVANTRKKQKVADGGALQPDMLQIAPLLL